MRTVFLRSGRLLILFASLIGAGNAVADPATGKDATTRAALYQKETCAALAEEHWRVTTNNLGRIVATHLLGSNQPGYDPLGYMTLVVTFKPKNVTDTECGINILASLYGFGKGKSFQKTFSEPMPINNPNILRDVNAVLARARKRLLAAHPEYAPPPAR